jgi:mannose-6-phosphate isomerase
MDTVVKLKPVVKSYIWGGNYFQNFNKGDEEIISELWELSVRDDDSSLLADSNTRLFDIIKDEDLGPNAIKFPYFPILIKLIDAKDNLSIQVHPSDDYALKNENSFGKSEMWYILDADEDAGLYVGLNKDYTKEEIKQRLCEGTITDALNFFKVKKGETYLINPGTIHAIGKGVRIIEIQQNSNLTYRLFDYFRKDKNGNYRELHIDKALKVIDFKKYQKPANNSEFLANTQYFKVKKVTFDGEITLSANEGSFISFTFIDGEGVVNAIPYVTYDTFFLPYKKECVIKGKGTLIISSL